MFASEKRPLHIGRWVVLLLVAAIAFWYYAPPKLYVFYSKDGAEDFSYVLNTQNRIVRGNLRPGETTGDVGHIFPNEDFFMRLDWWSNKGRSHCINITPRWPTTEIHLDRNGDIDNIEGSGTDADRLKPCVAGSAKP